ncbi:MAG TPA: type II toxin-antitoxin system death-on-curing family toxin [Gemmatimonadaceae bacterium]|nr:type II toxin-antitoxin system death-on-curing family toxin [Gemmatimonadaceae bacterium]
MWLPRTLLDAMHAALIEQYGGSHGVNDERLIQSALARPQNLRAYVPDSDLAALAASLCFGLAKNHGFRDGNKRTAFVAAAVFLRLNGQRLVAPEPEAVAAMVYVATDEWSEERLADWIRTHLDIATPGK